MGYWVFTLAKIIAMLFLAVLHSSKIVFWFSKGEGKRPSFRGEKRKYQRESAKISMQGIPTHLTLGVGCNMRVVVAR